MQSLPIVKLLAFIGGILAGSSPSAKEQDYLPGVVCNYCAFLSELGAGSIV